MLTRYEPTLPRLPRSVMDWRNIEYAQRVNRLTGERQRLVEETTGAGQLHVVYVMAHVGVTGGAKVIFDHANHLAARGAKVTIVCHYPRPTWYPVRCEYRQVPFQVELAEGIPVCDVIIATYWDHIQACVETGLAPVVYFEQGDFHLFEEVAPDQLAIVSKEIQAAAEVTTCSPNIVDIMSKRYGREITRIFPNAVDPKIFHSGHDTGVQGSKPYLMMMGSDQVVFKGTSEVLQAYAQVKAAGIDLDLVWVSPVPVHKPVGRVYVNPDQELLAELYRSAALFVSGSHYETFPLPPLEAMASGCPVVTTANNGVLTYAQDGDNCLLAEIGNPSSLADRITRVMEDHALRQHLLEGGLKTAARYDWSATADRLQAFYEHLSGFRPEPRSTLMEWEITTQSFVWEDGLERLRRLMAWTDADVILAPAIFTAFEGHLGARWTVVAQRRNQTSGREVRLWSPIRGETTELPYASAWCLFNQELYDEALAQFKEYFQLAQTPAEQAVYIRWIILCLLEQGRDLEALAILRDAIQVHSSNTDLMYLCGIVLGLQGRPEAAIPCRERVMTLAESASYPEFFWGVQDLAKERL